ncbi:Agamous-like MADS-box protein AGL82 [Linum grandiflorum]
MELIKNERNRCNTYKKRKANLLKKMEEFSILCGVEACLVVFQPPNLIAEDGGEQLQTWPSDLKSVDATIQRYRTSDGPKRCYYLSDYFAEKKKRVGVELAKINKQIYKRRFPTSWDSRLERLSQDQLKDLLGRLDSEVEKADRRLECFNNLNRGLIDPDQFQVPVRNLENYGYPSGLYGNEFQHDPSLQFGHDYQLQQQSSFMAMMNPNSAGGGGGSSFLGNPYWDQGNDFGSYEDLSYNLMDAAATELSHGQKLSTIDFQFAENQFDRQMVAAKVENETRGLGMYGGDQGMVASSSYGSSSMSDGLGQMIQPPPTQMQVGMWQSHRELDGQAFAGFEQMFRQDDAKVFRNE